MMRKSIIESTLRSIPNQGSRAKWNDAQYDEYAQRLIYRLQKSLVFDSSIDDYGTSVEMLTLDV